MLKQKACLVPIIFVLTWKRVIFQVTPMYENKNLPKIEKEVMGTAPG